jgi:hypothetical protein
MAHHIPPTVGVGTTGLAEPINEGDRALFAAYLVAARRRSGRSLDDISLTTKVPTRHLEALEQGQVERMPRGLYRRAIVRGYANAVGLDATETLERFTQTFGSEAVLQEWQGIPHIPRVPPGAVEELRQALALAPVAGMKATSSRLVAISTHALPIPKISRQSRRVALAAAVTVAVALTAYFTFDASRSPSNVARSADAGAPLLQAARATNKSAPATPAAHIPQSDTSRADRILTASRTVAATTGDVPLPSSRTEVESSQTAPSEPAGPVEARLVVTSQPPGARVTVDGIGWGVTPITIRHLPPGQKLVRLTKDGYLGQERQIRVGDEGAHSVNVMLRPRD